MSEFSNGSLQRQHWWAKAVLIGAVVAAALLPLAALGSRFGVWSFMAGFQVLGGAVLLAAIVLFAGLVGIVIALRRGLSADRPPLFIGTTVAVLTLAVMGWQFMTARTVPPIHDISTDVVDPPAFQAVVPLRSDAPNSLEFAADKTAVQQAEAYPWVQTLHSDLPVDQAVQRSREVLDDMGLEVVDVDAAAGRVEATDTTFWFGFKDDLVVRVRPAPEGSAVDVRSVSRVGISDLGANARRIGRFLDGFAGS